MPSATLINTILLIAAGIGAGLAYFRFARSNVQDNAIKALEATISAQKEQMHQLTLQGARQEEQIKALANANRLLESMVRGIPDWERLHKGLAAVEAIVGQYGPEYKATIDAQLRLTAQMVSETHAMYLKFIQEAS